MARRSGERDWLKQALVGRAKGVKEMADMEADNMAQNDPAGAGGSVNRNRVLRTFPNPVSVCCDIIEHDQQTRRGAAGGWPNCTKNGEMANTAGHLKIY